MAAPSLAPPGARPSAADVLRPDVHAGKVVLVTGGGTGIGRAVALDFAAAGARVVICGRRAEPLDEVRAAITGNGGECHATSADIRDEAEVERVVEEAVGAFGRVDVLVNNAGGQFAAPAEEISAKGWRAVHRLAVDATWAMTRQVAVRSMIPNRGGSIFFLAFSPRRGIPGMVHACAARAALENLAAGLALEWSRYGIRSICVAPGTIATPGLEANYSAADRDRWASAVPLGRLGRPEEVSGLISFLASPGGGYVTGTTIVVDGGVDAWGTGHPVPDLAEPADSTSTGIESAGTASAGASVEAASALSADTVSAEDVTAPSGEGL